jgi:hypothetical protein
MEDTHIADRHKMLIANTFVSWKIFAIFVPPNNTEPPSSISLHTMRDDNKTAFGASGVLGKSATRTVLLMRGLMWLRNLDRGSLWKVEGHNDLICLSSSNKEDEKLGFT